MKIRVRHVSNMQTLSYNSVKISRTEELLHKVSVTEVYLLVQLLYLSVYPAYLI